MLSFSVKLHLSDLSSSSLSPTVLPASSSVSFWVPACPLLLFSLYLLVSASVFTVQTLPVSGTLYCSSCLRRAQVGFLPPHSHLQFPFCHHSATMAKGSVGSPVVCRDCRWPLSRGCLTQGCPTSAPSPWDHGHRVGGTLAKFRRVLLEWHK